MRKLGYLTLLLLLAAACKKQAPETKHIVITGIDTSKNPETISLPMPTAFGTTPLKYRRARPA